MVGPGLASKLDDPLLALPFISLLNLCLPHLKLRGKEFFKQENQWCCSSTMKLMELNALQIGLRKEEEKAPNKTG